MLKFSRIIFSLFFILKLSNGFSQDEIWYRKAVQGKLLKNKKLDSKLKTKLSQASEYFRIDINYDSYKDGVLFRASEIGFDILIYDARGMLVSTYTMQSVGFDSKVLKYSLSKVGKNLSLLVVFFSEGRISYLKKSSKVRTYLLTISGEVKKENLFFQKGPVLFQEEINRDHKHIWTSKLSFQDLDGDGIKEVVSKTKMGKSSVFKLIENKKWRKF